jgi:hypothetical protein
LLKLSYFKIYAELLQDDQIWQRVKDAWGQWSSQEDPRKFWVYG